ncbi:MAG: hypothetical protein ACKOWO_06985 [Sediminibacterium sp.]
MFRKFSFLIILSILTHFNSSYAQADIKFKPFSKAEIALLDFITMDSTNDLSLDLFKENLRFGIPNKLTNGITLLKKKRTIYIQLMGSGQIYSIQKKAAKQYQLIRLDSTFHSGVNFGSINIFYKDTLFQFGGIGFWKIKDYFTFFSNKTHEWELFSANKGVPVFQAPDKGILYYVDQSQGKFYLSNSTHQQDFPNTLTTYASDTCRVFDFKERKWTNLGKLNPTLKEIAQKSVDLKTIFGPYLVFHSDLELYWLKFSTNQFGNLVLDKQAEFREKWLKIYKESPDYMYQFVLGSNYYLIRIENDGKLTYETITLNDKDFIDIAAQPVYTNNPFASFLKKIEPGRPIIGNAFIVLIVLLLYTFYNKKFKKKKIPQEVQSILYKNFFSSLTIVEKELIQSIYQLQIKNEQISIKTINKIIGVQQKDTITQNKSRSDYFLRINQKFKLATREIDSLIVKQREETDKRQYNYNINTDFIKEIEKLILNN